MRSQYNPQEVYVGTGLLSEYTFDFKIVNKAHLKVLLLDDEDELVWETTGDDTTYFSTTLNTDDGSIELVDPLPLDYHLMLLLADDAPTQPNKFVDNDRYTLQKIENSLDYLSGQIQRLSYLAKRTIRIPEYIYTTFTSVLPTMRPKGLLRINETGDGIEEKLIEEIIADISGTGLPPGGVEGDYPEKDSADTGDVIWASGTFTGYSTTLGQLVDVKRLTAAIRLLFKFAYLPPTISLSATASGTIREKGTVVNSTTLTAAVAQVVDPLQEVRFYQGATLLDTQTSGGGIPSGGNSVYSGSITPFSDNTTFSAQVDDTGASNTPPGTPSTASSSVNYVFVYPYYNGAGAVGLTGAQIAALTKTVITSTATVPKTMTATAGQVLYFAYPASYGLLTSILDANNFESILGWTQTTKSITGLDGNPVNYYCYEFNNPLGAGSYTYTFKR